MAFDIPDGPRPILTIEVVGTTPVTPEAATEAPVTELHRLTTSLTSYQTVVSWTVTTDKVGILRFVEMESDTYAKTNFKLTIAGTVQFTNKQIEGPLSLEWPDLRMEAGKLVKLEAKSTDGTEVNVDGDIVGKEVG